jgi:hypothetical protein
MYTPQDGILYVGVSGGGGKMQRTRQRLWAGRTPSLISYALNGDTVIPSTGAAGKIIFRGASCANAHDRSTPP